MKVIRYKTTYYSQKEFGIKEDLINLGKTAKRKIKENRGRLADKLQDRARELMSKQDSLLDQHLSNKVINPTLEKKLLRESFKRGNRVLGLSTTGSDVNQVYSSKSPIFNFINNSDRVPKRTKKKIINAAKKSKSVIFHPSNTGSEKLAHELGHAINMDNKNFIYRSINRLAEKSNQRAQDSGYIDYNNPLKAAYDSGVILLEEATANRHARELLKKHGISSEEMEIAEKSLKAGMDSYKNRGKAAIYNSLGKIIRGK